MHDVNAWSLNLGIWSGVRVRLHALFLLVAIVTMFLSTRSGQDDLVWYGAMCLGVLLASVLIHELAHRAAAARVGGHADQIVLGPLGGMVEVTVPPHEPQSELLAALAGPTANFVLWLLTVPLLLWVGDVSLLGLLNPLRPEAVVEGSPLVVLLKLVFWINWLLVLVNLLPAYPFDGGRVLRAVLWPILGYRQSILTAAWIARATAIGLCLLAWAIRPPDAPTIVAPWVPLVTLALFLMFSANQEFARLEKKEFGEELFSYDFSQGYTSLERDQEKSVRDEPGLMVRWLAKRRQEKERQRLEIEAAEESRVDEILARLHCSGMAGLSADEQALLHRVSARYRNRQKSS